MTGKTDENSSQDRRQFYEKFHSSSKFE